MLFVWDFSFLWGFFVVAVVWVFISLGFLGGFFRDYLLKIKVH